jgi:hypothetical protein
MPHTPVVVAHLVLEVIPVAVLVVVAMALVQLAAKPEVVGEAVVVQGLQEIQPQAAVEVEVDEAMQLMPVARAIPEQQQTIPLLTA